MEKKEDIMWDGREGGREGGRERGREGEREGDEVTTDLEACVNFLDCGFRHGHYQCSSLTYFL